MASVPKTPQNKKTMNGSPWKFWVGLVASMLTILSTGLYAAGQLSTEIRHNKSDIFENREDFRTVYDSTRDNSQSIAVLKAQMQSLSRGLSSVEGKLDRVLEELNK